MTTPPPPQPPPFGPVPQPDPPPQPPPPPPPPSWRNSTVVAALVPTLVFGSIAAYTGWRALDATEQSADADQAGKRRDAKEDSEKQRADTGPLVSVTRGEAPILPSALVLKETRYAIGPAAHSVTWDDDFNAWLKAESARPTGLYAVRITVKALRDDTTIIQDFKLKNRNCPFEIAGVDEELNVNYKGTVVYPPPEGGSGEDVARDVLGFNVGQYDDTSARIMEKGFPKLGSGEMKTNHKVFLRHRFSTKTVTLEQNDARTFDIYFASDKECTFGLEMNVTSGSTDTWIEIPIAPAWRDGKEAAMAPGGHGFTNLIRPDPGKGLAFPPVGSPETPFAPSVEVMADDVNP
ncbi:hypothetical protein GCM10010302_08070 [Streptomyces polychromogenes]|uniref:Uncharacterized protein n=1 Tax=Streptomyces polychromogenes TaxID=67342 RepID=A0ABN0V3B8_9ACTN